MKLVWKASAIRDLRRLHNFLARENSNAARRAVSRIRAEVKILVTAPLIGRAAEGMEAGYREWFIEFGAGFYIVLYRIDGAEIAVLAIRHNRELGY